MVSPGGGAELCDENIFETAGVIVRRAFDCSITHFQLAALRANRLST
jgi:hypothetical protein